MLYCAKNRLSQTGGHRYRRLYACADESFDAVLCGNEEVRSILYRAKRADGTYAVCHTRGFVLSDKDGNPEYFGGIIVTE